MTTAEPAEQPLADDEVYVYVGPDAADTDTKAAEPDAFQPHAGRGIAAAGTLAKVKISDSELDRLRDRIQRIASRLEAPANTGDSGTRAVDDRFAVDEITVHVGLSASGHFYFIASAGVEAAVDITWRRPRPGSPPTA